MPTRAEYGEPILKDWAGGESCPEPADAMVWPVYRGDANPAFGIRIVSARASRLDWSHDGGNDDIVGYRVAYRNVERDDVPEILH